MSIIDRLFGKKKKKDEPVVMKTAVEEQAKKAEPLTPKPAPDAAISEELKQGKEG